MRRAAVIAVLLGLAPPAFGQNLVPNPGFESFSLCPTASGEPYDGYVDDWTTPTNATSNYFNACTTGQWSVPGGAFFSPLAHGGDAYSGIYVQTDASADYREYIEVPLVAPLAPGTAYSVSFWVYRATGSRYAVKRIGAHFSVGSVGPAAVTTVLPLTPQVESSGSALDGGWIRISGSFVASGGEDHVVIGSFVDDAGTVLTDFSPCNCVSGSYYYVDDVSVERRTVIVPVSPWVGGCWPSRWCWPGIEGYVRRRRRVPGPAEARGVAPDPPAHLPSSAAGYSLSIDSTALRVPETTSRSPAWITSSASGTRTEGRPSRGWLLRSSTTCTPACAPRPRSRMLRP